MRHIQPFNLTQDIIDEETIEEDFAYRLEGGSVIIKDEFWIISMTENYRGESYEWFMIVLLIV